MNRIQRKFVEEAMAQPVNLSLWEEGFINDLAFRDDITPEFELTPKENEILNKIQGRLALNKPENRNE